MSRIFSDLEKKIISSLLCLDKKDGLNVLGNIISEYLSFDYFINVNSETDVEIMLKSDDFEKVDLGSIDRDLSNLLVTLVTLFEYFRNEGFIIFIGDIKASSLGVKCVDENYISCDFIDEDLKPLIYKYTNHKFFITETFKQFVKDDYQTKEEFIKAKEIKLSKDNLTYTRWALCITFVGLLASIIIPLFSTTSVKLDNTAIHISSSETTIEYLNTKLSKQKSATQSISNKLDKVSIELDRVSKALEVMHNFSEIKKKQTVQEKDKYDCLKST